MGQGSVTLCGDAPATSNILKDGTTNENVVLPCRNIFSKEVTAGSLITVAYTPHYNCFIVVSADCVS